MNARIERLNELLKQSPNDGFVRFALAKEMEKIGRYDDAVARLRELLSDDPGYVGAYYHLAALLRQTGNDEAAIDTYKKGIETARSLNDGHALRELLQALSDTESEIGEN